MPPPRQIPFSLVITFALTMMNAAVERSGGEASADELSIETMIEGMNGFHQRFRAIPRWKVTFDQERRPEYLPPGFANKALFGRFVNAQSGQSLYLMKALSTRPLTGSMDSIASLKSLSEPPIRCRWSDGVGSITIGDKQLQILPEVPSSFFEGMYFTNGLFLDIYDDHPVSAFREQLGAGTLSEAFWLALPRGIEATRDQWTVAGTRRYDDVDCVVVERTVDGLLRDQVWISPDQGYLPRQRTVYREDGTRMIAFSNASVRQEVAGVWLPRRFSQTVFNGPKMPDDLAGRPRWQFEMTVDRFELDFEDDLFDHDMLEQGEVTDFVRGVNYQVNRSAGDVREAPNAFGYDGPPSTNSSGVSWLLIINLLGLLLAVGWFGATWLGGRGAS